MAFYPRIKVGPIALFALLSLVASLYVSSDLRSYMGDMLPFAVSQDQSLSTNQVFHCEDNLPKIRLKFPAGSTVDLVSLSEYGVFNHCPQNRYYTVSKLGDVSEISELPIGFFDKDLHMIVTQNDASKSKPIQQCTGKLSFNVFKGECDAVPPKVAFCVGEYDDVNKVCYRNSLFGVCGKGESLDYNGKCGSFVDPVNTCLFGTVTKATDGGYCVVDRYSCGVGQRMKFVGDVGAHVDDGSFRCDPDSAPSVVKLQESVKDRLAAYAPRHVVLPLFWFGASLIALLIALFLGV